MTSSPQEVSDNSGEADEQQKHPEPQIQSSSPSTEISHPGVPAPTVQYATPPQLGVANAMGQAANPYPDAYYRSIFAPYDVQPYPAQPMVHLQLMGIQQAGVPLPSDAVEEPVFLNAKQYHGIMRRQSRAKAESESLVSHTCSNRDICMLCEELEGMGVVFSMQRRMKTNREKLLQMPDHRPILISTLTKMILLPQTAVVESFFHIYPETKVHASHSCTRFANSNVNQGLS